VSVPERDLRCIFDAILDGDDFGAAMAAGFESVDMSTMIPRCVLPRLLFRCKKTKRYIKNELPEIERRNAMRTGRGINGKWAGTDDVGVGDGERAGRWLF
jgi:hypothetical protein